MCQVCLNQRGREINEKKYKKIHTKLLTVVNAKGRTGYLGLDKELLVSLFNTAL